jgi:hypothetical protein
MGQGDFPCDSSLYRTDVTKILLLLTSLIIRESMGLSSWLMFNKKAVSKLVGFESCGNWLYNAKYLPKVANIFV